jgi:hypothetical protein
MSETGSCPRVLSALKLGNKPVERTNVDTERLEYYSSLEAVAAKKLEDEGFLVLDAGECPICKNGRCGHHIEIQEDLFKLIGHIDRRVILPDNRQLPVEIKGLGPDSFKLFEAVQFKESMNYAFQECCYLHHEKSPGIYWVMSRDSGRVLKYIVNDFNNEYDLPGFQKLTLPIQYDQIIEKLNNVELDIAEGKLSDPEPRDDCFWCQFKYLCNGKNSKVVIFVDNKEVEQAGEDYKLAEQQFKDSEIKKKAAVNTLIKYAKETGNNKFPLKSVSFSYHGLRSNTKLDEAALGRLLQSLYIYDSPAKMENAEGKKVTYDDIMNKVEKRSKPFDSYTIKILEPLDK